MLPNRWKAVTESAKELSGFLAIFIYKSMQKSLLAKIFLEFYVQAFTQAAIRGFLRKLEGAL
jgi:hypothetical protein